MNEILPSNPETCPNCYVGRIKRESKSLMTMIEGKPVSFPDFPAWVCDVCNAFVYDPSALAHLQRLISSNSTGAANLPKRKPVLKGRKLSKSNKAKPMDKQ